MATIKTSIMVHDGMSTALRHMNGAIQSVVSSFEQMHAATSESVDTRQFAAAQKEIALATQALNQFEQAVDQAGNEQAQTNRQLNDGAATFKQLGGAILGVVGAYATFQQIGNLVNFATDYSNTTARIAMMNDGLQTTAELQQEIYQAAQDSLLSYEATAAMVTKLGNNAASAFKSSTEIVDFAELVQKQFNIAGASAIEASNATLQLTQALGSGVLRGDELNSIFEQAPNIIQNIASYLDVPIGKIREMASNGEITAKIVKEAMFSAADDINEKFSAMPLTWNDIWTTMVNYAQNKAAGLALRISDFFNSETFQTFKIAATQAIDIVVMGLHLIIMTLAGLANWVATVGQFFADNWSWIAPILMTIGIVLGSILTILAVKYTMLGLVRVATLAWAAAQWVVNAAFLTNPITWVLIAIIAIIALVVYATVTWGEQTASVIGFIVGLFASLGAFIANIIVNIANILTMFAEFFINLFIDPVYAVKKLFYDLTMLVVDNMSAMASSFDQAANVLADVFVSGANIAIGAVNGLINALNMIPGVEIGTISKLSTGGGNFLSKAWKNQVANLKPPTSDKNVVDLGRAELLNIPDVFNNTSDWAYNGTMSVSNSLNGMLDKAMSFINYEFDGQQTSPLGDLLSGFGLGKDDYMSGLNDALNGIEDATKDTSKNTGKLADSATLLEDDLKYLREAAAQQAINRYTTAEIKVDMKNENHINSEMDIDGVIDRFGERVEEVVSVLAEGDGDDV